MKHTLILLLLGFGLLSHVAFAQEEQIDSGLLRDIVREHQLLSRYTECLSGKIEISRGSSTTEKLELSASRLFLFFRDNDLLRLEYINPMKGTEIFPGHEKNDITEVFMQSRGHNFEYRAVGSTGVPYANLSRSTVLSEAQTITLGADFYRNVNALFAPPNFGGAKVADLLQGEIGTIENRQYNDVADALRIRSPKSKDKSGSVSGWTVILDPNHHYALLFYEVRTENAKTEFTAVSSGTISSQVTDDGKIFPKEISFTVQTKVTAKGKEQEVNTGSRILVSIHSTDKPEARLFTEESFKDMGRDYTVVDILPNQKMAEGGHVVDAAPLESRMPYYPIGEFSKQEWSWKRVILMSAGILLTAVGGLRLYFHWRHAKTK
jgi:hypothetical protein